MEFTQKLIRALSPHADLIELGIPFSDPLADGPTIQAASTRALAGGMNTDKALEMVKKLRADGVRTPFVFMTYYNVIYAYGLARFAKAAKEAGAQGLLIPDLPMGEDEELAQEAEKNGLFLVQLIATNTPDERARKILGAGEKGAFTYLVSVAGTTGERKKVEQESIEFVKRIRMLAAKNQKNMPNRLCVGFGISDAEAGRQFIQAGADGVIVGSKLIGMYADRIKKGKVEGEAQVLEQVSAFAKSFKQV